MKVKGDWFLGFMCSMGIVWALAAMGVRIHSDAGIVLVWGGLRVTIAYALANYRVVRNTPEHDDEAAS